jgi:uncharacterized membrane protein YgdD (TMEM256/DUF423 family)
MPKFFLLAGALLGAAGVGLGAFGAHALKASLEAAGRLDTFETAVRYQFYHALALVAVGILLNQYTDAARTLAWSGWAFLLGTLVFSGSLYLICFTGIRAFGAIAPLGGLGLILGWVLLAWGVSRG